MANDLSTFVAAQLADAKAMLADPIGRLPSMLVGLPPVLACQLVLEVAEVRRRIEVLVGRVFDAAKEKPQ